MQKSEFIATSIVFAICGLIWFGFHLVEKAGDEKAAREAAAERAITTFPPGEMERIREAFILEMHRRIEVVPQGLLLKVDGQDDPEDPRPLLQTKFVRTGSEFYPKCAVSEDGPYETNEIAFQFRGDGDDFVDFTVIGTWDPVGTALGDNHLRLWGTTPQGSLAVIRMSVAMCKTARDYFIEHGMRNVGSFDKFDIHP